jgi:hypothetical protein
MLFGMICRIEPLKEVLDRERGLLVEELVDDALTDDEITASVASQPDLSIENLRADALTARAEILRTAANEEESLRKSIMATNRNAYENRQWSGSPQLLNSKLWPIITATLSLVIYGGFITAVALRTYDWTASWAWTILVTLITSLIFMFAVGVSDEISDDPRWGFISDSFSIIILGSGLTYAVYRISGEFWIGGVAAVAFVGIFVIIGVLDQDPYPAGVEYTHTEQQAADQKNSPRFAPIPATATAYAYEEWRRVLREAGVLTYLRGTINQTLLARYSTVLSVRDAPGLRYMGDLKYHVSTSSRDELMRRVSGVDGGSFALAGPRGAGKTILMRALCGGHYSVTPGRDLGVVVSAPVDYEPRDFVLYLYTEICKATKDHFARLTPSPVRRPRFHRIKGDTRPYINTSPHILARLADKKLSQVRYLQSFSTELSAKGGIKFAELNAKTAMNLAEQPLTYPEIVADLRSFLQSVADTVDGQVLIGIDELDRIGSGERARKFLDNIKAIFWVRGCYFLVSISEDALRAFEINGHGLRDAFDSAFDEVVIVEHLDFDASTTLLRARVTGMPLPYHALAYCLSGGLPRELMRSARAIVDQRTPDDEVKITQVTANLVADELGRHCRAARLALADTGADAAKAVELLRCLDQGCLPTEDGLRAFAAEVVSAAQSCSDSIRSLANTVATHAHYLAALAAVFSDQLTEKDIRRATDKATSTDACLGTLARARRYLGVNDAFARMLVDGFCKAWA